MNKAGRILCGVLLLTFGLNVASAEYAGWRHSGSFYLLTTPEGADLPASASEEGFPLLVRLDKDWFDFSQAKTGGEDIGFAAAGKPLAYQIEQWDPASGTAWIWVRIATVKGNAQQEVKMFWGKADAAGESSGPSVFNESNGYLSVWHMGDPVIDEAGGLGANDTGTTPCAGMIAKGRRFSQGKGISFGENIVTYPTGSSPHSSEAWFRANKWGDRIFGWGNGGPQAVVQMMALKPPHVGMNCYNSSANVRGQSTLVKSQWYHVVHTYKEGEARLYVNGRLDGLPTSRSKPLALTSPAMASMGGWRGHYVFDGDIDEVRISKVTRSADWVKLQYENQKPHQTAVGPLVRPGSDFSVSREKISLSEKKGLNVTARAGGARKLYWIVSRGGRETVAAVDRFSFTLDAGRVSADESLTLRLKAVCADTIKTLDIPVTVREDIPEPDFSLKSPVQWDGRETIEVVPRIANLEAMRAKGAGELKYDWSVSGIAVIKEIAPDRLLLRRSQNSGTLVVTAKVSNGGEPTVRTIRIEVKEPARDPWARRTPDGDEKPINNQFFARDDNGEGTLHCNGTLDEPAEDVFLKLYRDGRLIRTESRKPGADKKYAFSVKLKAGLVRYKVELGTGSGETEKVLHSADNLVCGDVYIIQGQSNAVAYNYHKVADRPDLIEFTSDWIRSYGSISRRSGDPTNGGWGNARLTKKIVNKSGGVHFIGVWGMAFAKKLLEDQKIPICIINGAAGGTRIDEHMPDPANHLNTSNPAYAIYGNLMRRVVAARLTHGVRGVLWHQGESDQGYGPNDCFGCETYQQDFVDLSAAWKRDYPNIRNYYVFQIWPDSCSMGHNGASDRLRDVQRRLSRLYRNLSVLSTLSLPSGKSCHFDVMDYEKMGHWLARLVERDDHGREFEKPVSSPDLTRASYTSVEKDEISLEFDQPMAWDEALAGQFYLDGQAGRVVSGEPCGNTIKLKLATPASARTITYLIDGKWDIKNLLYGLNGIAALTFCEVPLEPAGTADTPQD